MKYDVKKELPAIYNAKKQPNVATVPAQRFLTITGHGNPNNADFAERVGVLYAHAYGIKMGYKKSELASEAKYDDYTVFPLEGYWTISDAAINTGSWTKDDLVYELRLGLPDFVPADFITEKMQEVALKKSNKLNEAVVVKDIPSRLVASVLHVGAYDNEPVTFARLADFLAAEGYKRTEQNHVEIYLSDARKTVPEKLKTILQVEITPAVN